MAPLSATQDKPPGSLRQRSRKRKPDARLTHLHTMQTHVHRLHQEVESLKLTRQLLLDRHLQRADQIGGSYERIVREYFECFRFGMIPDTVAAPVPSNAHTRRSGEQFLRAIMDENVDYSGPERGVERFIEMNKMYAMAFSDNHLTLLNIKLFPVEGQVMTYQNAHMTVTGWGRYSSVITPTTIEMLFPHIKSDRALVTKLLGQQISGIGRFDFVFDTASNRVIATNADLNFVPVFMEALKNPHEVARLLDRAHITPEYVISTHAEQLGSPTRPGTTLTTAEPVISSSNRVRMEYLLS